jgi:hypothetical protein
MACRRNKKDGGGVGGGRRQEDGGRRIVAGGLWREDCGGRRRSTQVEIILRTRVYCYPWSLYIFTAFISFYGRSLR